MTIPPYPIQGPGRPYDLIAFDVDGTLVGNVEGKVVWNLLNRRFCADEVTERARLEDYLAGRLTYQRWVDLDIGGWARAGATREEMAAVIRQELYLVPGARDTLRQLDELGYRMAVISGTLDITLEVLLPEHPFEVVFTNAVEFDAAGRISGWMATRYDMEGKARALAEIAGRMGIPTERTVYVGDNINDVHAMALAGFAVAFEPKHPSVADAADHVIAGDLRQLLPLLRRL